MESFQLKKAVIIGDSRVEGYCKTLNNILDVVETCQFSDLSHQEIALQAENYINRHHPNIIILITLSNDLIDKNIWENGMRCLFYQKVSFNPHLALENIKYYSERWSLLFPGIIVIWTIPDVPNLIDYNMNDIVRSLTGTERRILSMNEKDIYKNLNYIRENWMKTLKLFPNIVVLALRGLTVNEIQEKASSTLHVKYGDIRVFHNSKFYKDGLNPVVVPKPLLAELFASEIESVITSKLSLVSINASGETFQAPRSPSPAKENLNDLTKSILRRLRDRHEIEWFSYISNPQTHPDYENEKSSFMENKAKEMVFKGVYPSAEEISNEWSLYWKNKLEELYNEVWKKKKQDCLELLPSSSNHSYKSLELLPTCETHKDRRRHGSSSSESFNHHRNFSYSDYDDSNRFYNERKGRGRKRFNKYYHDSSQFR